MFEDLTPLTWQRTPHHAPVYGSDASEIGTVDQVLGDHDEDIFHGLALRRHGGDGVVELPAVHIKKITEQGVLTDLDSVGAAALQPYSPS